jgi:hypothetical protein
MEKLMDTLLQLLIVKAILKNVSHPSSHSHKTNAGTAAQSQPHMVLTIIYQYDAT